MLHDLKHHLRQAHATKNTSWWRHWSITGIRSVGWMYVCSVRSCNFLRVSQRTKTKKKEQPGPPARPGHLSFKLNTTNGAEDTSAKGEFAERAHVCGVISSPTALRLNSVERMAANPNSIKTTARRFSIVSWICCHSFRRFQTQSVWRGDDSSHMSMFRELTLGSRVPHSISARSALEPGRPFTRPNSSLSTEEVYMDVA